jgi:hypothetical protein
VSTDETDSQREARLSASSQLDHLTVKLAVDGFGATASEVPIEGYRLLTRTVLDNPLAGVRAAIAVRNGGERLIRDWADKARAAGTSWDEIGEALGLLQEGQSFSREEAAFEYVVDSKPLPKNDTGEWQPRYDQRNTYWSCGSCGQRIIDRGPYESHPDDNESGHAEGCERHAAEVAAWKVRTGWDDE